MSMIYALVARAEKQQQHVLAEYTSSGLRGNFSTVTRVLLKKIGPGDSQLSYQYDTHAFHYTVSDGLIYLCMTDLQFPRQRAFQFLSEINKRFISTYGDRGKTALAFEFNADFERVLQAQMERFNRMKDDDKITRIRDQVSEVKTVMIENIDKVLERGEKIELLVDKSDMLDQHAFKFKKHARTLKRAMWWKNVKMMIIIFVVIVLIIYAILAAACGGFKLKKC